jgi:hypothetical protein
VGAWLGKLLLLVTKRVWWGGFGVGTCAIELKLNTGAFWDGVGAIVGADGRSVGAEVGGTDDTDGTAVGVIAVGAVVGADEGGDVEELTIAPITVASEKLAMWVRRRSSGNEPGGSENFD